MPSEKPTLRSLKKARLPQSLALLIVLAGVCLFAAAIATGASAFPTMQSSEEGETIFNTKCAGCHSMGGGRLIGPDLAGITQLRDRQWLVDFMLGPEAMFASGDPTANELLKEYNNVKMPNLGLSEAEVEALIAYMESAPTGISAGDASANEGAVVLGDPLSGEMIFTGQRQLINGGTSCLACHSVNGVGGLAGGTLGPDLTQVYARYGENGLTAALTNVSFPSMVGIYSKQPITPQEQADLIAFFHNANQRQPAPAHTIWIFLAFGVLLMLVLFGVMAVFWPSQIQSISERLRNGGR